MNDGQINTAIAESMGWTDIRPSEKWGLEGRHRDITRGSLLCDIPEYIEDLNAMHEVTQTLSASQQARFVAELSRVVGGKDDYMDMRIYMIHSTAAHRAEAYLKTIGKWET